LIDKIFTVVYATECVLKIFAFGFIIHKKSYLRDGWNILDFAVVIVGLISLLPNVPNLKSLRVLRVLRPLRSINAIPSMKRQVATIIRSMPRMGYVASLLLFFMSVSAILGLQIFSRDLYKRCRLTD
jgi:voltage-dependent calcium channel L type alpha-1D